MALQIASQCACAASAETWPWFRPQITKAFFVEGGFWKNLLIRDWVYDWLYSIPCPYDPLRHVEAALAAELSDCLPGEILLQVVCAQQHLLSKGIDRALAHMVEVQRLASVCTCCDSTSGWPLAKDDV